MKGRKSCCRHSGLEQSVAPNSAILRLFSAGRLAEVAESENMGVSKYIRWPEPTFVGSSFCHTLACCVCLVFTSCVYHRVCGLCREINENTLEDYVGETSYESSLWESAARGGRTDTVAML